MAKEEAMRDDDDAFTVRCAAMSDEARDAMATSKDIKIVGFSVSARGAAFVSQQCDTAHTSSQSESLLD